MLSRLIFSILRRQRALAPHLPIGRTDKTFEYVRHHLDSLKYEGPVGLSCDDTKLLAAFRPYHDAESNTFYVVGNAGEPLLLADPEAFRKMIREHTLSKADKVCHLAFAFLNSESQAYSTCRCGYGAFKFPSQSRRNHSQSTRNSKHFRRRSAARTPYVYCRRPSTTRRTSGRVRL